MGRKRYDYLIVGAGLYGATFAHCAVRDGLRCLVVDKRRHAGGNLYCENMEGITVHRYGPHIFHTSDQEIWELATGLVPFNSFTNSPLANYEGRLYSLPFNMNTFHQIWGVSTPTEAEAKLEEQRAAVRRELDAAGVREPQNLEQEARLRVGDELYRLLVKEYTEKQWGRSCASLPPFLIQRLPVRLTYDNNYFDDLYQGIPAGGYNPLISRLLEGSDLLLDTDYLTVRNELDQLAERRVYTGMIDRYYGYCHGRLEYRALRFDTETLPIPNYQGNAVVNFTSQKEAYTRIIEHKHLELRGEQVYERPVTVVSREYPGEWKSGMEPCYPVNDTANDHLYRKYREMTTGERDVIFGGRLAEYRYYDMAPAMRAAMEAYRKDHFRHENDHKDQS